MSVFCVIDQKMTLEDVTRKVHLAAPLAYDNSNAHSMRVTVFNQDGTEADLTGISAVGSFMRLGGNTVTPINGTVTGNVAEVVLPGSCYVVPGRFRFTLNLCELTPATGINDFSAATAYSKGDLVVYNGAVYRFTTAHSAGAWTGTDAVLDGNMRTALWVEGVVERNISGTIIDPGTPVGNIEQAISSALSAASTATAAAADATAAAADATAAASHSVRYDTAQTLEDTDKATARGNIGAASQVDQASLDNRTNALHKLVNYGYDTDGHLNVTSLHPYTADRVQTQLAMNSTGATSDNRYMRLTGNITRVTSGSGVAEWTDGVQLEQGHTYILRSRLLSGSVSITGTSSPQVNAYEAGTSTSLSTERSPAGDVVNFWRVFTAGSTPVNIVHITLPGTTYTNAVYQITLEDISDISEVYDRAIAPHNGLTASQAYTSGALLMQSGRLLQATADIASGAAISGKATETSVASQLAARDVSISAVSDGVTALATRMTTAEGDIDALETSAVRNTSPNLPYRIFDWRQLGSVLNDVPTGWGTGYYKTDDGTAANSTNSIRTRAAMDSRFLTSRDLYAVVTPPSGRYVRVTIFDGETYKNTLNTENTVDLPIRFEIKSGYRYLFTVGTFNGEAASYVTEEYTKQVVLTIYMSGENKTLANTAENYIWNATDESLLKLPSSYTVTGEPTPLIVLCHGLSDTITSSSWGAATTGRKLVNNGFAVMDVNQVTTADWYNPALIKKYIAALKNIVQNYNVRVDFVFGFSMGSGIALTLSTLIPGIKACAASGIRLDFASRYAAGSEAEKAIVDTNLGFTNGYDPLIAAGWCKTANSCVDGSGNAMNPVQFPPLLLLYGDSDTLTLTESLARAQEIKRGGTITVVNEYSGDHAAMCNLTAGTSLTDTVAWFNTWL